MRNITLASPYPVTETVQTANGEGLQVSQVGTSLLRTSHHPLKLNSVLYVPRLSHNLLSVHRLCLDNNCWLIFDAFSFWFQDKATWRILFQGACNNGLYPIPSLLPNQSASNSKLMAYLGKLVNSTLWHNRLGHPSNLVSSTMLKKSNIVIVHDTTSTLCQSCLEGKFSNLTFSICYKYYVLFTDGCT